MDAKEILGSYVGDMLGAEKHCLESLERQTHDEKFLRYREAHDLLLRIENVLRMHTTALEQCLSQLDAGGMGASLKKAATTAIGAIAGWYGKMRPEDPVSRSLRDDYTALNHIAISYTMLHTTACGLNESRVADLALQHLHEITPLVVALSRIIPSVVTMELSDEGKVSDPSAWRAALDNTQKAWSSDVVGEYH
jgi:hypothetical protein